MKYILISLLLVSCGDRYVDTRQGEPGKPCTVSNIEGGALISCPDGSQSVISNGKDGSDGIDGTDGKDGINGNDGQDGTNAELCTVEEVIGGAKIVCGDKSVIVRNGKDGSNGKDGVNGTDGTNGKDGTDGVNGIDGKDTEPCVVSPTDTGVKITCGTSVAYINNGKDGERGQDGIDGSDGKDGTNGTDGVNGGCSVVRYKDSAKITCTDGTETIIEFPTIKVITVTVDKDIKGGKKDGKDD